MRRVGTVLLILLLVASSAPAGIYLTIVRRPPSSSSNARSNAAIEARRQMSQAQTEFTRAYVQATLNHPLSVDLKMAQVNLAKARQNHSQVMADAKATLYQQSNVRKLNLAIADHEEKLLSEKDAQKRIDLATELLALRKQRSTIESDTFGMDANITVAQAGVLDAMNNLRTLEQQYQWELVKNEQFAAAKARLDAARERLSQIGN